MPTPTSAAGDRGQRLAAAIAPAITIKPSNSGSHRALKHIRCNLDKLTERARRELSEGEAGNPSNVWSWRITIIAPTPHEKPETTACGTLAT